MAKRAIISLGVGTILVGRAWAAPWATVWQPGSDDHGTSAFSQESWGPTSAPGSAIPLDELLPLNGTHFGLHPSCGRLAEMVNGNDDIGRGGRIFPKLSADEYFCAMLRWLGVTPGDMDQVLPNIRNFDYPASAAHPVGFIA